MSRASEIKRDRAKSGEIIKVRFLDKNMNTQISSDGILCHIDSASPFACLNVPGILRSTRWFFVLFYVDH
jgi:hypothetical protein